MKKILLLFTLIISISIFAQKDWTLYKSVDGINIYYKYTECHDIHNGIHKELVVFKFENKTENTYELSWTFDLIYSKQESDKTQHSEQARKLILKRESSLSFSCDNPEYSIFVRHLNYPDLAKLEKFELANMKLQRINN